MRRRPPYLPRNLLELFDNSAAVSPRSKIELPMDIEALNPKVYQLQNGEQSHHNFSFQNLQNIQSEPNSMKDEGAVGESYSISATRKRLAQQYSISVTLCSPKSTRQGESSGSIMAIPIVSSPGILDRPPDGAKLINIKESIAPESYVTVSTRSMRLPYSTPAIPEERIEDASESSFINSKDLKLELDSDKEEEPEISNQSRNFVRLRAATPNLRMPSEPLIRFRQKSLTMFPERSIPSDGLLLVEADSPKGMDPGTPREPKGVFLPLPGLSPGIGKRGSFSRAPSTDNVLELSAFDDESTPPKTPRVARINRSATLAVPSEAEIRRNLSKATFSEVCSTTSLTKMQDATLKLRNNKESQLRSTVLAKRFETPTDKDTATVTSNRRL